MANQYNDLDFEDDEDDTQTDNAPAGLRKALKREQREKQKLAEQLAELQKSFRERSLKDVLDAEGVNPKIAAFIPPNLTSPAEVKTWLDEYADVFGAAKSAAAPAAEETDPSVEAMKRMNSAINSAEPAPGKLDDQLRAVANAKTRAELDALTGNLSSDSRRNLN